MTRHNAKILPCGLAPAGDRDLLVDDDELERRSHSLIVTRYFLNAYSPKSQIAMTKSEMQAWFAERERIFNKYCLPSIVNQKKKNKTWLLFIEKSLVNLLPKSLTGPQRPSFIEIVEVDSSGSEHSSVLNYIKDRINNCLEQMKHDGIDRPVVTVSRLDNDDALSFDFLTTLSRLSLSDAARISTHQIITFPHGIQYLENKAVGTYLFNNNHFLSSYHAERCESQTMHAMSFNHGHLFVKNKNAMIVNTDLPMWIEIVHGGNVSNKFRLRFSLQKTDEIENRFGAVYSVDMNIASEGAKYRAELAANQLKHKKELELLATERSKAIVCLQKECLQEQQVIKLEIKRHLSYRWGAVLVSLGKKPWKLPALPWFLYMEWRSYQADRLSYARREPLKCGGVMRHITEKNDKTTSYKLGAESCQTPDCTAEQSFFDYERMLEVQKVCNAMKPNDFLRIYANILVRQEINNLLEIGVHKGGSLKFWRELYGPGLKLYGLDINNGCAAFAPKPADKIFIGSQTDTSLLDSIERDHGPFDLIIDDGPHQNQHMWITFNHMFKAVRPGGVYIVEDMFTSYWKSYGGGLHRPDSFVERCKGYIDVIYADFMGVKYSKHHIIKPSDVPLSSLVTDAIDSITFHRCGIVVFQKKISAN